MVVIACTKLTPFQHSRPMFVTAVRQQRREPNLQSCRKQVCTNITRSKDSESYSPSLLLHFIGRRYRLVPASTTQSPATLKRNSD